MPVSSNPYEPPQTLQQKPHGWSSDTWLTIVTVIFLAGVAFCFWSRGKLPMPRYENREKILADWLAGMTGQEIAKKYGCSINAGQSLARARGLSRSPKVVKMALKRTGELAHAAWAKSTERVKLNKKHKEMAAYAKRHGVRAAAEKYGYTYSRALQIAKRHGWEATPLDKEAILKDYGNGVPIAQISVKYGCDKSYPATMAKRAGVKRRRVRVSKGN